MLLSPQQLAALARWEPIAAGFGLTDRALLAKCHELRSAIQETCGDAFDNRLLKDGSLSNYFAIFLASSSALLAAEQSTVPIVVTGTTIQLSLLAPIAVAGAVTMAISRDMSGGGFLNLGDVSEGGAVLAPELRYLLRDSGFRLATCAEMRERLPEGVGPMEYCLSDEPWDRTFHVLFADTD